MKAFKSSSSRLARLFYNGREQWKQRAKQKQKRLRSLEVNVRDLRSSRDQWKERARQAEAKLEEFQQELASSSEKKRVPSKMPFR